jgi:hypothetical protein
MLRVGGRATSNAAAIGAAKRMDMTVFLPQGFR